MNVTDLLDILFLRRIGYEILNGSFVKSRLGEEFEISEAMGRYREWSPRMITPDLVLPDREHWIRFLSRREVPSYEETVERLKQPKKRKISGFHQTPVELARFVIDRAVRYLDVFPGFSNAVACDPACGSGIFLCSWLEKVIDRAGYKAPQIVVEAIHHRRLSGYDTDELAIYAADLALREVLLRKAIVPWYELCKLKMPVICQDWLDPDAGMQDFDLILGNPPYVRIQNQTPSYRKRVLKSSRVLVGRFDLSLAFVEKALDRLKQNGILAFILSNKMLMTNYGKKIRPWLVDQHTVLEIHDLGESKIFSAAILPMVLIVRRGELGKPDSFLFSQWGDIKFQAHHNCLEDGLTFGTVSYRKLDRDLWSFTTGVENKLLDRIEQACPKMLGDYAQKICVGIKTTANSVFANPITERFLSEHPDLREIAHPAIRGTNIERWMIRWTGRAAKTDTYLLYPHREVGAKRIVIPWNQLSEGAQSWFTANRTILGSRTYIKEARREWYEIWVPQTPSLFKGPKIVVPDISVRNKFALDENDFFCLDSAYTIKLKSSASREEYLYLLAWLNSQPIETYFKSRLRNSLYSKRLRYMKSTLTKIPVIPYGLASRHTRAELSDRADLAIRFASSGHDLRVVQEEIDSLVLALIHDSNKISGKP